MVTSLMLKYSWKSIIVLHCCMHILKLLFYFFFKIETGSSETEVKLE